MQQINTIWRFFTNEKGQWKWQRLTVSRAVIDESRNAYKQYEACITDAQQKGYVQEASQAKILR